MARIAAIGRVKKERYQVHATVKCDCCIFDVDGVRYLQLDTYGLESRQERGKISQSLQLDQSAAALLRRLLDEAFPE